MRIGLTPAKRPRRIIATSAILAGVQLLGGGANYLLQRLIATRFGASAESDAYFVVIGSQVLLSQMFAGILTFAMLPRLVRIRQGSGERVSWELALVMWSRAVLGIATFSLLLAVSGPVAIKVLAPGFPPETTELAAKLLRFSLFGFICYASALVLGVLLQSYERFLSTAMAHVLPIVGGVVAVLLVPTQEALYAALAGFGLGAVAALFIQLHNCRAIAGSRRLRFTLTHPEMHRTGGSLLPVSIAFLCSFAFPIIQRMWASGLPEGSVSSLAYATLLVALPTALVVAPLTAILLPRYSALFASDATDALAHLFKQTVVVMVLVGAAFGAAFVALSEEIVTLLLKGGSFGERDVARTAGVVAALGAGIFAVALSSVLGQIFCAAGKVRVFAMVWLVTIAVGLLLDALLAKPLGVEGLGLVYSASYLVQMVLLLRAVGSRLLALDVGWVNRLLARAGVGATIAVVCARLAAGAVQEYGSLAAVSAGGGALAVIFASLLLAMRGEEIAIVRSLVRKRV